MVSQWKIQHDESLLQNYGHIKALASLIDHKYQNFFISLVSFTKRSTFKVDLDYRKIQSNELIVYDIELSEFIHRKVSVLKIQHKEPLLSERELSMIYEVLSNADIKDPAIRREHEEALKAKILDTDTNATCSICNKPVSDKVKAYCLSNKKFDGKIYCYEHQKTIQ